MYIKELKDFIIEKCDHAVCEDIIYGRDVYRTCLVCKREELI